MSGPKPKDPDGAAPRPAAQQTLPVEAVQATQDVPPRDPVATQDTTGPEAPGATASLAPGRRIGPYRIVRELGRGGMGAVHLATRADEAYEKQVAIKLILTGAGSAEVISRFKRERQILARLDHPNIARLLDGGTTDDGLPYFVMEYIEGKPIHAYCDEKRLPTVERLKLFLAVCSAVAYAHRSLIVHRDIKPGNILVTAEGVPRLLDFGIAKLIDPEHETEGAQATAVAFTPWYASPEQIRAEPLTTATDVYSLGVLLYELLTGHSPYRLKSLQPLDVLRAIVEQEAEQPSDAVERRLDLTLAGGHSHATLTPDQVSRTREGSPERLRHRLRGDLDTILLMALRKEPQRRYPSVEAFAADVRRYLEGRPIGARKGSVAYRARKFLLRHRWGAAVATTAVALIAASGVNVMVQSRRVARERDKAETVSRFLVGLFSVSDPSEARGNTVTAREVLDKGVERIGADLKDQPEVRADLLDTMGSVYDRLGLYDKAVPLLRDALAIRRRFANAEPEALATTLNALGNVLVDKGDLEGAEAPYREALGLRRRLFRGESKEVAESLNNLASVVEGQGHYDEAETLFEESLAVKRNLFGNESQRVATTLGNLAIVRYKKGDRAGAEGRFREVLGIQRKVLGEDHPDVAGTLESIGVVLDESGDYAGAERAHREALAIQRKVLGAEHPDLATTLGNLANTLNHAGRPDDAEPLYREALAMSRKFLGDDSTDVAATLVGLGDVERQRGVLDEAETLLRQSAAIRIKRLGQDHPDVAESLNALAEVLRQRHKLAEAETAARRGLAIREAKLAADHPGITDSLVALGLVLRDAGRFADAEASLLRAAHSLEGQKAAPAARRQVLTALAELYERWGKAEPAARYRAQLAAVPGPR